MLRLFSFLWPTRKPEGAEDAMGEFERPCQAAECPKADKLRLDKEREARVELRKDLEPVEQQVRLAASHDARLRRYLVELEADILHRRHRRQS